MQCQLVTCSSASPRTKAQEKHGITVVGGGAAGLTAAYFAAKAKSAPVTVLERTNEPGKKILISGGTRW